MYLIETSKDLLYVVIAISIFGLTVFICWSVFYLSMILRQVFKIIKEMRDRLHKADEIIRALKEKIEHSTSYLLLIGEGVKKLVEVIKEHTHRDTSTSSVKGKRKKKKE